MDISDAKMTKHHSAAFIVDGKIKYSFRSGYQLDKKMDLLLNPLSEEQLIELLTSWRTYYKKIEKLKLSFENFGELNTSLVKIVNFTNKYETELIKTIIELSSTEFPCTDHRYFHVNSLIVYGVKNQLERRNLRRIFGKSAETVYREVFAHEVVKPTL